MMGAIGAQTTRLRVGVVVTDLIRRHPAVLAQTMLTLDHLTEGRAICGLGSGWQLREYAAAGLRHLVIWNITAFGDPALARFSFGAMTELRTELAG